MTSEKFLQQPRRTPGTRKRIITKIKFFIPFYSSFPFFQRLCLSCLRLPLYAQRLFVIHDIFLFSSLLSLYRVRIRQSKWWTSGACVCRSHILFEVVDWNVEKKLFVKGRIELYELIQLMIINLRRNLTSGNFQMSWTGSL